MHHDAHLNDVHILTYPGESILDTIRNLNSHLSPDQSPYAFLPADAWEHPCRVTYEELPESEKEYDRMTALETIKVIIAIDYRIGKPSVSR